MVVDNESNAELLFRKGFFCARWRSWSRCSEKTIRSLTVIFSTRNTENARVKQQLYVIRCGLPPPGLFFPRATQCPPSQCQRSRSEAPWREQAAQPPTPTSLIYEPSDHAVNLAFELLRGSGVVYDDIRVLDLLSYWQLRVEAGGGIFSRGVVTFHEALQLNLGGAARGTVNKTEGAYE